jgi:hypothetical protein
MIITFNPDIFKVTEYDSRRFLAKIILLIVEKNHFIDLTNLNDIFFEGDQYSFKNHIIAKNFFSPDDHDTVESAFDAILRKSVYMTQLHQNHLTRITIGQKETEIQPEIAYRILFERSKVIVENGINDWKFIKSVCHKYTSHKGGRATLYKLIKKTIESNELISENAGGEGGIIKIFKDKMANEYKQVATFKLMALFDSDRNHAAEFETHKDKIAFFKGKEKKMITPEDYNHEATDVVTWHILYKRALENYVPLSVLLKHIYTITEAQRIDLQSKTNNELDFQQFPLWQNDAKIYSNWMQNKAAMF